MSRRERAVLLQAVGRRAQEGGGARKKEAGRVLDGRTYDEMPQRSPPPTVTRERRRRIQGAALALARPFVPKTDVEIALEKIRRKRLERRDGRR